LPYEGLYLKDTTHKTLKKGQFYIDRRNGGWGGFTMGLFTPDLKRPEKSFGVFGIGKSCVKGVKADAAAVPPIVASGDDNVPDPATTETGCNALYST